MINWNFRFMFFKFFLIFSWWGFFFLFYQHTRYDLISTSKYSMKFHFLGFWKQSTSHCNPILGALGNNLNIHSLIKYSWGSKKQFYIKIWKTTVFTFKSLFGSTEKFYFSPSNRFSQILSHAWVNEIIDYTIIKNVYSNSLPLFQWLIVS